MRGRMGISNGERMYSCVMSRPREGGRHAASWCIGVSPFIVDVVGASEASLGGSCGVARVVTGEPVRQGRF